MQPTVGLEIKENKIMQSVSVLVSFSIPGTQHPQLQEERFNLAHSFKTFSPWPAGSKAVTSLQKATTELSCSVHGDQKVEQKNSTIDMARDHTQHPVYTHNSPKHT